MSTPVYRGMSKPELDAAYNNREAVPDSAERMARWKQEGEAFRASHPGAVLDVRYGPAPRACLDYFPNGAPDAPLLIFIHGGYWLFNHKDMFAGLAAGPLAAGFDVAMLGYTLAPEASLATIAAEVESAADFLAGNAPRFGFRRDRIIASGWSAGGHLATMLADHPAISAVLSISGIYDLEPISLCYLNDGLRLTPEEIETLSPIRLLRPRSVPILAAYGEAELPELQRQSADFVAACAQHGQPARALPLPGRNHFSIMDEFGTPGGRLVQELRRLAGEA